MKDTLAWVHLSDFHFGEGQDHGRDEVWLALLQDLERFAGKREPGRGAEPVALDFILLTGDLAHGGKAVEYQEALRFLVRVQETTGVRPERTFVVPGNHDIDRSLDVPASIRGAVKGCDGFVDVWRDPGMRALFGRKLSAYRVFARRVNPSVEIREDQPGGFCHRLEHDGRVVALLGLSSCWLGQGGDEERGHLVTGKEQALDLAGGAGFPALQDADLRIAMLHHPLEWMQEFDGEDMGRLLGERVDLVLRGHLHATAHTRLASPGREMQMVAAGSAYAGSRYRNAYNVVQVTFGDVRRARIWLRAYSATAGEFVKDVETYAAVEDGTWEWDLPGSSGRREPHPGGGRRKVDLGAYFHKLREDNLWVDVRGMGAAVTERMPLDQVYTRLRVAAPAEEREPEGDPRGHEDQELRQVLPRHPDLVLVGDPGAGKTTFLRFVALNLARAHLGEGADEAMARLGLEGPPPFPLLVSLGRFGQFLRDDPDPSCPPEAPEHLLRFLRFSARGFGTGLPAGYLEKRLEDGGCILLLDGLDEVPGDEMRERVGRIVEQVAIAGRGAGSRHLVTSRTRAYHDKAQLTAGFTRARLVDFGPDEVAEFVRRWSLCLHRVAPGEGGTPAAATAAAYGESLLEAIRSHPGVGPLTRNPLMLTVLAVVHWNRRQLPEQRAELYNAAIDYLIESRSGLSPFPGTQRRECFRRLALGMFEDPRGVRKSIGRASAAEAVRPLLGVGGDEALTFLESEELASGIIVSRETAEVVFWHLSFQEYLAAEALAGQPGYWGRLEPHLFDPQWAEVVLLLAGCLRRLEIERASDLVRSVLGRETTLAGKARAVGLVGRILRDIAPYGGDPAAGTGYAEALRATLAVFEKGTEPVAEAVRVEVGEALGQAGDPRLAEEEKNWVPIPAGSFLMGAQDKEPKEPGYDPDAYDREAPVRRVTISAFQIGRYPVTVEEYRRFVEAGDQGYLDRRLWPAEGWKWREEGKATGPDGWEEQVRHPNRPVVGVSWYEAVAYCAWLGRRTRRKVMLPTEAQWEYAARGKEGRVYPWGDEEPAEHHANFRMRVGHPTPVGIYPLGATPEGVQDFAGNVWEWCLDWAGTYGAGEATHPSGSPRGESRGLRGGGYFSDRRLLRAAYRLIDHPGSRYDLGGFRCVVELAGGQSG